MKYAFTHCNLIDGRKDSDIQEDMTVLVEGDRIVDISKTSSDPTAITGYFERNLNGSYLLPGLINLHEHHFSDGKPAEKLSSGKSQERILAFAKTPAGHAYLDYLCQIDLRNALMSGVTTIRGVGDLEWADVRTRDRINAGRIIGPRFFCSGPAMTVPNGHGAYTFARVAETPDQFRALVRDCVAHNVDFIKMCVTGGVMDSTVAGECGLLRMNLEQTKAICEEAAAAGLYVASHTECTEGVEVALTGGVHTIEHGAPLTPEIVELYKRSGAVNVATISVAIPFTRLSAEQMVLPEVVIGNSEVILQRIIDATKDCLAAGITVGLGTDAACPYTFHYDMWRELVNFSKYAEVSPAFAIHTATMVNASILGIADETGSIECGKCADMIVVADNPLDDLSTLRDVRTVMVRGRIIDHPTVKRLPEFDAVLDSIM